MSADDWGLLMDCFIMGDMSETELRRRMHEQGVDDYNIDALVASLKLLSEAKLEVA